MSRLFIADHLAVADMGHNLEVCTRFASLLAPSFSNVLVLAPNVEGQQTKTTSDVHRVLYYPYLGVNGLPGWRGLSWIRRLYKVMLTAANIPPFVHTRRCASRNWRAVFRDYGISSSDVVFLPSADYYGLTSLAEVVRSLPDDRHPSVVARFIGVSEQPSYSPLAKGSIYSALMQLSNDRSFLFMAETLTLKDYLAEQGVDCVYMPLPLSHDLRQLHQFQVHTIGCLGSARADKGYFRINSIVEALRDVSPSLIFRLQASADKTHSAYTRVLANYENVRLLPAKLSRQELDEEVVASGILLLPYDREIYARRGSAMLEEGTSSGALLVVPEGTGLAREVRHYGNGVVVEGDGYAESIMKIRGLSKEEIHARASASRELYAAAVESGRTTLLKWLNARSYLHNSR